MNYKPIVDGRASALVDRARKRVDAMDVVDFENGAPAPADLPLVVHAATIEAALGAGLNLRDWDVAADAYVMLLSLIRRLERRT